MFTIVKKTYYICANIIRVINDKKKNMSYTYRTSVDMYFGFSNRNIRSGTTREEEG